MLVGRLVKMSATAGQLVMRCGTGVRLLSAAGHGSATRSQCTPSPVLRSSASAGGMDRARATRCTAISRGGAWRRIARPTCRAPQIGAAAAS